MAEGNVEKKKIQVNDRLLLILKILILANGVLFTITNLINTQFAFLHSWISFLTFFGHILWGVFVLQLIAYLIIREKRNTWFTRSAIWTYGSVIGIYIYNTFSTNAYIPKLVITFVNGFAFVIACGTILLLIASVGYTICKNLKK